MPDDRDNLRDALRRTSSKPLRGALERAQEKQASTLGDTPAFRSWQGAWVADRTYRKADVVEHEGSSWRARLDNKDCEPPPDPESASDCWELIAERGKQGALGARGFTGDSGSGSNISIQDEGIPQGVATVLDFVGAGVTAADIGGVTTVTIPGGTGTGDGYSWQSAPTLAVSTGQRFYADRDGTIDFCRAERSAGDGGSTATLDVLLNGASIFPVSPKPTVAAGSFLGAERTPDTAAFIKGDYFEVEIEATGGGSGPLRLTIHFS